MAGVEDTQAWLEEAARSTLDTFPVEGVERMVVTLAGPEGLSERYGEDSGGGDLAGFTASAAGSPQANTSVLAEPGRPGHGDLPGRAGRRLPPVRDALPR